MLPPGSLLVCSHTVPCSRGRMVATGLILSHPRVHRNDLKDNSELLPSSPFPSGSGSSCQRAACECDKKAAECFKRNLRTFNKSYQNYLNFKCKGSRPSC